MKNIFLASALLIAGLLIGFNWVSNAQTPQQPKPPFRYEYLMVVAVEWGGSEFNKITIINPDGTKQEKEIKDIALIGGKLKENYIINSEKLATTFQELGNYGWELVTVSSSGVDYGHRYDFKRIKR
jgi:hypothetical protein